MNIDDIRKRGIKIRAQTWEVDPETGEKREPRKWRLIKNGQVVNTIVAQPEYILLIENDYDQIEEVI